ncbi:barstar family protein [Streptomyces phyllanthi]|uniref:barstar family protein n=1 Tax=Streptomyces phyllanthi TaxID=1803180 RepID=UPI001D151164|nr:barstar family protein [Streptomyces phyllanthi]
MTATTAWIRSLTEMAPDTPTTRGEVRGSRCRTKQDLFTEWAAGLGFPDHFGHNWDAFHDCLRDILPSAGVVPLGQEARPPAVIVLREVCCCSGRIRGREPTVRMAVTKATPAPTRPWSST